MRRLLDDVSESQPPVTAAGGAAGGVNWGDSKFDSNMVIVLAALLGALVCAFALNSILRYALQRDRRRALEAPPLAVRELMKQTLRQMPVGIYGQAGLDIAATDCPICLGEFADGEKVRVLPRCNHGFHVRCVDTWLAARPSCPSCRRSLIDPTAARGCDGEGVSRQPRGFSATPSSFI